MKQLNLLPEIVRIREAQQQLYTSLVVAGVAALAAVGVLRWAVNSELASVQNQLATVQSQNKPNSTALSAADTKTVQRITALNTLSKTDTNWPTTFHLIGDLVAKDITLTSYHTTVTANGVDVVMAGTAPSNVSFATFADAFQGNKLLTGTKVSGYNYDPTKGIVSFTVEGILLPANTNYSK
jgi:hypothetical protein